MEYLAGILVLSPITVTYSTVNNVHCEGYWRPRVTPLLTKGITGGIQPLCRGGSDGLCTLGINRYVTASQAMGICLLRHKTLFVLTQKHFFVLS